jgi:hypothetical protein
VDDWHTGEHGCHAADDTGLRLVCHNQSKASPANQSGQREKCTCVGEDAHLADEMRLDLDRNTRNGRPGTFDVGVCSDDERVSTMISGGDDVANPALGPAAGVARADVEDL